jgi:uncharacterized RDD family membrane protein YckC
MDQILDTPVNENKPFEYAGFWIRFAAYFIDTILLLLVDILIEYAVYGKFDFVEQNPGSQIISLILGVLYFSFMESSERQATLGKMAVGVQVGDEHGNRLSFGNAIGRYLAKIPSALILLIGFMMAGWDDRKQALHDKIAGTFVFYKN